ncbi:MAG: hypothetical protein V4568_10675 [Pseudomonadota bacterium]
MPDIYKMHNGILAPAPHQNSVPENNVNLDFPPETQSTTVARKSTNDLIPTSTQLPGFTTFTPTSSTPTAPAVHHLNKRQDVPLTTSIDAENHQTIISNDQTTIKIGDSETQTLPNGEVQTIRGGIVYEDPTTTFEIAPGLTQSLPFPLPTEPATTTQTSTVTGTPVSPAPSSSSTTSVSTSTSPTVSSTTSPPTTTGAPAPTSTTLPEFQVIKWSLADRGRFYVPFEDQWLGQYPSNNTFLQENIFPASQSRKLDPAAKTFADAYISFPLPTTGWLKQGKNFVVRPIGNVTELQETTNEVVSPAIQWLESRLDLYPNLRNVNITIMPAQSLEYIQAHPLDPGYIEVRLNVTTDDQQAAKAHLDSFGSAVPGGTITLRLDASADDFIKMIYLGMLIGADSRAPVTQETRKHFDALLHLSDPTGKTFEDTVLLNALTYNAYGGGFALLSTESYRPLNSQNATLALEDVPLADRNITAVNQNITLFDDAGLEQEPGTGKILHGPTEFYHGALLSKAYEIDETKVKKSVQLALNAPSDGALGHMDFELLDELVSPGVELDIKSRRTNAAQEFLRQAQGLNATTQAMSYRVQFDSEFRKIVGSSVSLFANAAIKNLGMHVALRLLQDGSVTGHWWSQHQTNAITVINALSNAVHYGLLGKMSAPVSSLLIHASSPLMPDGIRSMAAFPGKIPGMVNFWQNVDDGFTKGGKTGFNSQLFAKLLLMWAGEFIPHAIAFYALTLGDKKLKQLMEKANLNKGALYNVLNINLGEISPAIANYMDAGYRLLMLDPVNPLKHKPYSTERNFPTPVQNTLEAHDKKQKGRAETQEGRVASIDAKLDSYGSGLQVHKIWKGKEDEDNDHNVLSPALLKRRDALVTRLSEFEITSRGEIERIEKMGVERLEAYLDAHDTDNALEKNRIFRASDDDFREETLPIPSESDPRYLAASLPPLRITEGNNPPLEISSSSPYQYGVVRSFESIAPRAAQVNASTNDIERMEVITQDGDGHFTLPAKEAHNTVFEFLIKHLLNASDFDSPGLPTSIYRRVFNVTVPERIENFTARDQRKQRALGKDIIQSIQTMESRVKAGLPQRQFALGLIPYAPANVTMGTAQELYGAAQTVLANLLVQTNINEAPRDEYRQSFRLLTDHFGVTKPDGSEFDPENPVDVNDFLQDMSTRNNPSEDDWNKAQAVLGQGLSAAQEQYLARDVFFPINKRAIHRAMLLASEQTERGEMIYDKGGLGTAGDVFLKEGLYINTLRTNLHIAKAVGVYSLGSVVSSIGALTPSYLTSSLILGDYVTENPKLFAGLNFVSQLLTNFIAVPMAAAAVRLGTKDMRDGMRDAGSPSMKAVLIHGGEFPELVERMNDAVKDSQEVAQQFLIANRIKKKSEGEETETNADEKDAISLEADVFEKAQTLEEITKKSLEDLGAKDKKNSYSELRQIYDQEFGKLGEMQREADLLEAGLDIENPDALDETSKEYLDQLKTKYKVTASNSLEALNRIKNAIKSQKTVVDKLEEQTALFEQDNGLGKVTAARKAVVDAVDRLHKEEQAYYKRTDRNGINYFIQIVTVITARLPRLFITVFGAYFAHKFDDNRWNFWSGSASYAAARTIGFWSIMVDERIRMMVRIPRRHLLHMEARTEEAQENGLSIHHPDFDPEKHLSSMIIRESFQSKGKALTKQLKGIIEGDIMALNIKLGQLHGMDIQDWTRLQKLESKQRGRPVLSGENLGKLSDFAHNSGLMTLADIASYGDRLPIEALRKLRSYPPSLQLPPQALSWRKFLEETLKQPFEKDEHVEHWKYLNEKAKSSQLGPEQWHRLDNYNNNGGRPPETSPAARADYDLLTEAEEISLRPYQWKLWEINKIPAAITPDVKDIEKMEEIREMGSNDSHKVTEEERDELIKYQSILFLDRGNEMEDSYQNILAKKNALVNRVLNKLKACGANDKEIEEYFKISDKLATGLSTSEIKDLETLQRMNKYPKEYLQRLARSANVADTTAVENFNYEVQTYQTMLKTAEADLIHVKCDFKSLSPKSAHFLGRLLRGDGIDHIVMPLKSATADLLDPRDADAELRQRGLLVTGGVVPYFFSNSGSLLANSVFRIFSAVGNPLSYEAKLSILTVQQVLTFVNQGISGVLLQEKAIWREWFKANQIQLNLPQRTFSISNMLFVAKHTFVPYRGALLFAKTSEGSWYQYRYVGPKVMQKQGGKWYQYRYVGPKEYHLQGPMAAWQELGSWKSARNAATKTRETREFLEKLLTLTAEQEIRKTDNAAKILKPGDLNYPDDHTPLNVRMIIDNSAYLGRPGKPDEYIKVDYFRERGVEIGDQITLGKLKLSPSKSASKKTAGDSKKQERREEKKARRSDDLEAAWDTSQTPAIATSSLDAQQDTLRRDGVIETDKEPNKKRGIKSAAERTAEAVALAKAKAVTPSIPVNSANTKPIPAGTYTVSIVKKPKKDELNANYLVYVDMETLQPPVFGSAAPKINPLDKTRAITIPANDYEKMNLQVGHIITIDQQTHISEIDRSKVDQRNNQQSPKSSIDAPPSILERKTSADEERVESSIGRHQDDDSQFSLSPEALARMGGSRKSPAKSGKWWKKAAFPFGQSSQREPSTRKVGTWESNKELEQTAEDLKKVMKTPESLVLALLETPRDSMKAVSDRFDEILRAVETEEILFPGTEVRGKTVGGLELVATAKKIRAKPNEGILGREEGVVRKSITIAQGIKGARDHLIKNKPDVDLTTDNPTTTIVRYLDSLSKQATDLLDRDVVGTKLSQYGDGIAYREGPAFAVKKESGGNKPTFTVKKDSEIDWNQLAEGFKAVRPEIERLAQVIDESISHIQAFAKDPENYKLPGVEEWQAVTIDMPTLVTGAEWNSKDLNTLQEKLGDDFAVLQKFDAHPNVNDTYRGEFLHRNPKDDTVYMRTQIEKDGPAVLFRIPADIHQIATELLDKKIEQASRNNGLMSTQVNKVRHVLLDSEGISGSSSVPLPNSPSIIEEGIKLVTTPFPSSTSDRPIVIPPDLVNISHSPYLEHSITHAASLPEVGSEITAIPNKQTDEEIKAAQDNEIRHLDLDPEKYTLQGIDSRRNTPFNATVRAVTAEHFYLKVRGAHFRKNQNPLIKIEKALLPQGLGINSAVRVEWAGGVPTFTANKLGVLKDKLTEVPTKIRNKRKK